MIQSRLFDLRLKTCLALAILALILAGAMLTPSVRADYDAGSGKDAGNSFSTATHITLGETYQGKLTEGSDDEDWYSFSASSGNVIMATMTPPSDVDYDVALYDPSDNYAAGSFHGSGDTETVAHVADATGNWAVKIEESILDYGTGAYTFKVDVLVGDAGTGGDAGNSFSTATPVSTGTTYQGILAGGDIEDWYSFSTSTGNAIVATMTPQEDADFDLALYDPSGELVTSSDHGLDMADTVVFTGSITGNWAIEVSKTYGAGLYSFSIDVLAGDAGTSTDAGNSFGTATPVSTDITYQGLLIGGDTEDWYSFSVTTGTVMKIIMTPPAEADFDLALYNPSGDPQTSSYHSGSQTESVTYTADTTGDWVIRIDNGIGYGTGMYTFRINTDTTPPVAEAGSDITVNVGQAFSLDGGNSHDNLGITSYYWDCGDGVLHTTKTITHTYNAPGVYDVTLTVKDAAGNTASDTMKATALAVAPASSGGLPAWILWPIVGLGVVIAAFAVLRKVRSLYSQGRQLIGR